MQLTDLDIDFKYNLSLVAIMKYEEKYVKEWVAFHKVVGFDHFYIYDNDENSYMDSVLSNYIAEGTVSLIHYPGEVKMFEAYAHSIDNFKNESKYIAYIDADEFLFTITDRSVYDIVDEIFHKYSGNWYYLNGWEPGSIGINWVTYGTNNHKVRPEGLTIENYSFCGNTEMNIHIKSIVNPRTVYYFANPHFPIHLDGYCQISQEGSIIHGPFFPDMSLYPLRINHYFYRSEEEFRSRLNKRKADRPISDEELSDMIESKIRESRAYNLIKDKSAFVYINKVKDELARINS